MKRVTITKISLNPYIKWVLISYLIFGVLTGLSQAIAAYLTLGGNAIRPLFWTYASLPLVYLAAGTMGSIIFIFLYNNFNRSIGSYMIEVDEVAINDQAPPPPPDDLLD